MLLEIAIFFVLITSPASSLSLEDLVLVEHDLAPMHVIFLISEDEQPSTEDILAHTVASYRAIASGSANVTISPIQFRFVDQRRIEVVTHPLEEWNNPNNNFKLPSLVKALRRERFSVSYCKQFEMAVYYAIKSKLKRNTKIFIKQQQDPRICDMEETLGRLRAKWNYKYPGGTPLSFQLTSFNSYECSSLNQGTRETMPYPFEYIVNVNERCRFMTTIHNILNVFTNSSYAEKLGRHNYQHTQFHLDLRIILEGAYGSALVAVFIVCVFAVLNCFYGCVVVVYWAKNIEDDFHNRIHLQQLEADEADYFDVEDVGELVRRFSESAEGAEEDQPPIVLLGDQGEPQSSDEKQATEKSQRLEAGGNESGLRNDVTDLLEQSAEIRTETTFMTSPYIRSAPL